MSGHYLKLFVPANSPTRGHRCRTSGWGELQAVTVGRGEQISYPELSTRRRSSGFESRFMRQSLSAHSIPGSSPQRRQTDIRTFTLNWASNWLESLSVG